MYAWLTLEEKALASAGQAYTTHPLPPLSSLSSPLDEHEFHSVIILKAFSLTSLKLRIFKLGLQLNERITGK